MASIRGRGALQRVHTVNSEKLEAGALSRCLRNRVPKDGYIPTLNQFRGAPSQIANGVWRLLNMPLTINSITPRPITFVGQDAVAGGWAERHGDGALALQGSGPTYQQPAPFRDGLGAVEFDGTGFFEAASAGLADVATEDIVIEFVFSMGTINGGRVYDKRDAGTVGHLVQLTLTGTVLMFYLQDSSGASTVTSGVLPPGSINHAIGFFDRSGSGQWYVNGGSSGAAADISARALTLSNAANFSIGDRPTGDKGLDSGIYYFSMRLANSWLDSHLQPTIATQRAAALFGWLPLHASGSDVPNTMSRNCEGYSDRWISGERTFFATGKHAMRWSEPEEGVHGPLGEPGTEQILSDSHITEAVWTKADVTDTTATSEDGPFGSGTAEGWVASTTDGDHYRYLSPTYTAAQHVQWAMVKAGAVTWAALYMGGAANVGRFFNLTTGALGGTIIAAPEASYTVPLGGGWWLIAIVDTNDAAARQTRIYPAAADGDTTFAGNGSDISMYFAHAQVELGAYHSSPIRTVGGTATRLADSFQLVAGDNIGGEDHRKGTCIIQFRCPDRPTFRRITTITDSGIGSRRIQTYLDTDGKATLYVVNDAGGKNAVSVDAVDDATLRDLRCLWDNDSNRIALKSGTAALVENLTLNNHIADDLDELDMMQFYNDEQQLDGILPILRFLARPSVKG